MNPLGTSSNGITSMNRSGDGRGESSSAATPALRGGESRQLRATPPQAPSPRRIVDLPSATPPSVRRSAEPTTRLSSAPEGRRMVVAKEITLAGQISRCDFLVVEGNIEGMRYDGQSLEVTEGGSFNGSIEVDAAEIAGTFEGVMHVRGRLSVRPSGRVTGTVRYGELEVNSGGQLNGELQSLQPAIVETPARNGRNAASSAMENMDSFIAEESGAGHEQAAGE